MGWEERIRKSHTNRPNHHRGGWDTYGQYVFQEDFARVPMVPKVFACDCLTGGEGRFERRHTEVCPDCGYYCVMKGEDQLGVKRAKKVDSGEIRRLTRLGMTRMEVAAQMGVSISTVKLYNKGIK